MTTRLSVSLPHRWVADAFSCFDDLAAMAMALKNPINLEWNLLHITNEKFKKFNRLVKREMIRSAKLLTGCLTFDGVVNCHAEILDA